MADEEIRDQESGPEKIQEQSPAPPEEEDVGYIEVPTRSSRLSPAWRPWMFPVSLT
jgi:hypothetical protein